MQVGVFLTSDGVELGRAASTELAHVRPFKALAELVEGFLEKGGLVWSCAPCFQHRGLDPEENHAKVVVTGAGPMLEWIAEGAATISV
jgi:predicted peroxiredoxin